MNKWFQFALVVCTALLSACASDQPEPAPQEPPMTTIPTTNVRIAAEYRADAPTRYIVKKGDTLWHIASLFLNNPGRWQEIWHANPRIENPNRIYPGDVIAFTTIDGVRKLQVAGSSNPNRGITTGKKTSDGLPIYDLYPAVEVEVLKTPIPTIPKDAVYPFMNKNLVVEPQALADYPYIVGQADNTFGSLSGHDIIYAKGEDFSATDYDIYRQSRNIKDPVTGENLGVLVVYVGQLKLTSPANEDGIASFIPIDIVNPIFPNDIVIPSEPAKEGDDLFFFPKLADIDKALKIIQPLGVSDKNVASQFSSVLINAGSDDGMSAGDVFKVIRRTAHRGKGRNGETFKLPDHELGMAIIYKTTADFSYALIMQNTDAIYAGDRLVTP